MVTLFTRHTVQDFEHWKSVFDGHRANRELHGASGHRIMRTGNDVVVLTDFPDAEHIRAFLADPALQTVVARAGFLGPPTSLVLKPVVDVDYG